MVRYIKRERKYNGGRMVGGKVLRSKASMAVGARRQRTDLL